jgi:DNA-binding CsgD family transcriptional regulator
MSSRRGRPPHPDVLTPRQQEVLELLREGLTNREIAEKLDISTDGAKFHVSEILTRIGVTSRVDAVRWAEGPERATASLHARIPRWPSRGLRARLRTGIRRRGTAAPGCGHHQHRVRRLAA